MIFWYILAGIVALITIALLMPIKLSALTDDDGTLYTAWHLFGLKLSESRDGPEPYRASKYTARAIRRRQKKANRQQKRARERALARREGKKVTIDQPLLSSADIPLTDQLHHLKDLIVILFRHTLRHARVDIHTLAVTVASDDAAKTAMLYGGACAALSAVTEALHSFTNLHIHHPERYGVAADFLGEESKLDVRLTFRLPLFRAIALEARLLSGIFTRELEKIKNSK